MFTPEQKQDMIGKLTETTAEIEGESLRPATMVAIEAVRGGEWSVAEALTAQDVRDVRAD